MDMLLKKYALPLMAYGFVRSSMRVQDAYIEKLTYDEEKRKHEYKKYPLLHVQKGAVVLFSTLLTPGMFPVFLYNDLKTIEKKVRGIDDANDMDKTSDWSRKSYIIDYLFE